MPSTMTKSSLVALAGLLPAVLASPAISPVRILGRQNTNFANLFKDNNCSDSNYSGSVALNSNSDLGGSCPEIHSADYFNVNDDGSGSYSGAIQITDVDLWNGQAVANVRSPVIATQQNCGTLNHLITEAGCYPITVEADFFVAVCDYNDQTCNPTIQGRSDDISDLSKRIDGSCFSHGGAYNYLDTSQEKVVGSQVQCDTTAGCSQQISQSVSISDSISLSVESGVEGLFSATFSATYTEESSTSLSYTFSSSAGQAGQIIFTPMLTCYQGSTSSCGDNVPDGPLTMCRHQTDSSGNGVGVYTLEQLN